MQKNTNSTPNDSQTQRARTCEVRSFLSTDCELSTNPCSRFLYSIGPRSLKVFLISADYVSPRACLYSVRSFTLMFSSIKDRINEQMFIVSASDIKTYCIENNINNYFCKSVLHKYTFRCSILTKTSLMHLSLHPSTRRRLCHGDNGSPYSNPTEMAILCMIFGSSHLRLVNSVCNSVSIFRGIMPPLQ